MELRVTQFGEPILRKEGAKIEVFDAALKEFGQNMIETMYAEEGIGLAAQQVDQALQLFVLDVQPREPDQPIDFDYTYDGKKPPLELFMPMVVVNPKLSITGEETVFNEGCLSFGDIRGEVKRPSQVRMEFQDMDGNPHVVECNGIFARCILHEYDHLQGVLFIDRMETRVVKGLESKIKKIKRQSRDFLKTQKQ